jgi:hypothetical protein
MDTSYAASLLPIPLDMRDALNRFDSEAAKIIDASLAPVGAGEPPPIIYHYTNDVGLRGILETGQIWLSDIFELNDPSELKHGLSLALDVLEAKAGSGPPESKVFARDLTSFVQQVGIQKSGHYFMCSFSSCGDDLGQWRAYADNGRGYALGFDAKALEDAFANHAAPLLESFPIIYNDLQLVEIHRKLVGAMFDLISLPRGRGLDGGVIQAYMAELTTLLMVHALHAALHFKHEAYNNEKEYRFLEVHAVDKPPKVELRVRHYSLIKYRQFNWKSVAAESLKRIVVGPAADYENASQFARDCLSVFPAGPVDITRSEIPYRVA